MPRSPRSRLAVLPFSAFQLQLRAFYAMADSRTPAFVMCGVAGVNIVSGLALANVLPAAGPRRRAGAVLRALPTPFGAAICFRLLSRRLGGVDGRRITRTVVRSAVAGVIAAGIAYAISTALRSAVGHGVVGSLLGVLAGALVGGSVLPARRLADDRGTARGRLSHRRPFSVADLAQPTCVRDTDRMMSLNLSPIPADDLIADSHPERPQRRQVSDMVTGWFVRLTLIFAVIAVFAFDGISVLAAHFSASDDAQTAAQAAASGLPQAPASPGPAVLAAEQRLPKGETLVPGSVHIDNTGGVTLKVRTHGPLAAAAPDLGDQGLGRRHRSRLRRSLLTVPAGSAGGSRDAPSTKRRANRRWRRRSVDSGGQQGASAGSTAR